MRPPVKPQPVTILLVADNAGDAGLARAILGEPSSDVFEVEHVDRLNAALERLGAGGIDAVLLDLGLPDSPTLWIDALELLKRRLESGSDEQALVLFERAVNQLEAHVGRSMNLIDDLLDFARLEAGQPVPLNLVEADPNVIAAQALEGRPEQSGHALRLESTETGVRGQWNGDRLGRVLKSHLQRHQAHARGGADHGPCLPPRGCWASVGDPAGPEPRRGHPGHRPSANLRTLPPRAQRSARDPRHRPGPVGLPSDRRAARRYPIRNQSGGRRQHVHGPTPRLSPLARGVLHAIHRNTQTQALKTLGEQSFDMVIFRYGVNGWEVAGAVRYRWPDVRFLLATGCGATIRTCVGTGDTGTDQSVLRRA